MEKIAHITDLHLDEAFPAEKGIDTRGNFQTILDDVASRGIHRIVITGDIGTPESHQWFVETVQNYDPNFKLTIGNHDSFSSQLKNLQLTNNSELFYRLDNKSFREIYLDSSSGSISETQFSWLKKSIDTHTPTLLFIHHPVLDTGCLSQKNYPLKNRDRIKTLLQNHTMPVYVFCGHLHFQEERSDQNIHQFITPAACYQGTNSPTLSQMDSEEFGYRIIIKNEDCIETEVIIFQPK